MDDQERAFRVALLKGELPLHPDPSLGCIRRNFCCRTNPGWFGPGEVEGAAAAIEMSVDEFIATYVVIDAVVVDGQKVEVFVPVKSGRDGKPLCPPATRVDELYLKSPSRCVFFVDKGCAIYKARPLECRGYSCTNADEDNPSKEEIGRMWLAGR